MKKFVISILAAVTLVFSGNLLFAADLGLPSSFKYPIRRGTTLSRIAKDFGVSQKTLIEANQGNPSFKSPDKILAGGKLRIPNVYTQADVDTLVKKTVSNATKNVLQTWMSAEEKHRAESWNSNIKVFLLMIGGFVLFVFWIKSLTNYWDEKTLLEEA